MPGLRRSPYRAGEWTSSDGYVPEGGMRLRRNVDMKLDRAFALVMCGFGLAACSSFTVPGTDAMKPKPTTTVLLIQSNPAGTEARSSLGRTCVTPCTMAIGAAGAVLRRDWRLRRTASERCQC